MEFETVDTMWPPPFSGVPRSESTRDNLHLTDITKTIEGLLYGEKGGGFDDMNLTMECGFIWERLLENAFAERHIIRPPEIVVDGIACSPDGVEPDEDISTGELIPDQLALGEYKFTWKSIKNRPPEKDWSWMVQVKAYCYVLEIPRCIMRICYIFGDWKGTGPMYRKTRFVFTQEELGQNWEMIVNHKPETIERLGL